MNQENVCLLRLKSNTDRDPCNIREYYNILGTEYDTIVPKRLAQLMKIVKNTHCFYIHAVSLIAIHSLTHHHKIQEYTLGTVSKRSHLYV